MATENFSFKTLLGSDVAGYTSVNSLIDSIDVILRQRVFRNTTGPSNNHVMIFSGTWGENASGFWTSGLVGTANLSDAAVTAGKIATSAVTTEKINTGSVTADKLGTGSVTAGKLAVNSVVTSNIADGQVTAAKLDTALLVENQILPSGMIVPYAGNTTENPRPTPPAGWLYCDGAYVLRSLYPGLEGVIGTTYGPYAGESGAPGSTTHMKLPNLVGKTVIGSDASQTEFSPVGKTGGSKAVTITSDQSGVAAHAHTVGASNSGVTGTNNTVGYSIQSSNPNHGHTTGVENATHTHTTGFKTHPVASGTATTALVGPGASSTGTTTYTSSGQSANHAHTVNNDANVTHSHLINNDGHTHNVQINNAAPANAAQAHNNLQPYITLNYIIKI
jgi:microcystin-dependent protein